MPIPRADEINQPGKIFEEYFHEVMLPNLQSQGFHMALMDVPYKGVLPLGTIASHSILMAKGYNVEFSESEGHPTIFISVKK